jgi:hypothetical protein
LFGAVRDAMASGQSEIVNRKDEAAC